MYTSADRAVRRHIAIRAVAASAFSEPIVQRLNERRRAWAHSVICGYARSGSSLLQTLLTSTPGVQSPPGEYYALDYARRHRIRSDHVVTKKPADVQRCDEIRRFYEPSDSQAVSCDDPGPARCPHFSPRRCG
jgi:hypothetical protein